MLEVDEPLVTFCTFATSVDVDRAIHRTRADWILFISDVSCTACGYRPDPLTLIGWWLNSEDELYYCQEHFPRGRARIRG